MTLAHTFFRRLVIITLCLTALLIIGLPLGRQHAQSDTGLAALNWTHLSSTTGDLDVPAAWAAQTSTLILDLDRDGLNDFVIAATIGAPAVTWYRNEGAGNWAPYVIEASALPVEAGAATFDIDSDGDLDVVLGANYLDNNVWWWENPYPNFDPAVPWTRRDIKNDGLDKHHDQIFGDFNANGIPDLVFWNQEATTLMLADIPADPRNTEPWPYTPIFVGVGEGLSQADIDGDGVNDLLGGGRWFKYDEATGFTPYVIDNAQALGRIVSGDLIPGSTPEVVMVLGDGYGPLMMYECVGGDPVADPGCWSGTNLLPGITVDHGHSLGLADFNNDGFLDIFNAEMRLNGGNSDAGMWLFLNDGSGNFTQTTVTTGIGNHKSAVGDLDGDGDVDILDKPFNWDTPRLDIWLNDLVQPSLSLDGWERHVIDPAKPWRSVLITAGDMNGDNLQDVITGGWVYLNPGDPAGDWARQTIGEPLNNMAAVFDIDGDSDLDVLGTEGMGSATNTNFVWAQNNSGSFTLFDNVPAGAGDFLQGVAVAPFQNGEQAVALSWHHEVTGVQTLTLPADPVNSPWTWAQIAPVGQGEALSAGDIDRDGDIDLLLGTEWLRNDGTEWTLLTLNPTAGLPDRNRLVDVNQDGRLDAVVGYEGTSSLERLAWYEQPVDVNATWTEHIISTIISPMSLDVADMDRDGDLDVVVGEHNLAIPANAGLFVFENLDGAGGSWARHVIYVGDEHHDGAQVVDIDSDGDLDVISLGWSHSNVLLYENLAIDLNPPGPGPLPAPTDLTATALTETQIDLAWIDHATDESRYRLERSPDGAVWFEFASLPADATAYSDTGLTCGVSYHYRVRAYRAADDQFSAYSAASIATTPPCPAGGRVTAGLQVLYNFTEGSGTTVHDISGVGSPLNLTIDEATSVRWLPSALAVDVPTMIVSATPATKIINAVRASNAITIEAWITPANVTQSGPARIVSLSYDLYNRDFTLGQGLWGTLPTTVFDVRLRTTTTNLSGQPSLTSPAARRIPP